MREKEDETNSNVPLWKDSFFGTRGQSPRSTYSNGKVNSLGLDGKTAVNYIKDEKKISASGLQYGTNVYVYESGNFVLKDSFWVTVPEMIYSHNDEEVTEEEYDIRYNKAFDYSKSAQMVAKYSLSEFLFVLKYS